MVAALALMGSANIAFSVAPNMQREHHWSPIVYPEGAPSEILELGSERSLADCSRVARLYSQVAPARDQPMGAICMRACWPLEAVIRPNDVRTINNKCRVYEMVTGLSAVRTVAPPTDRS
jgi:hypothetical protein